MLDYVVGIIVGVLIEKLWQWASKDGVLMVDCSNYRSGACMLGECSIGNAECCQACSVDCSDKCNTPDGKGAKQ